MTEEKRFELIKELKESAEEKNLNITTLFFLIATMTDARLEEFYNEFFNIK